MEYSQEQLTNEVQSMFDEFVAAGRSIHVDWLANTVMDKHRDVHGTDKDFYVLCAWHHVKTSIRQVVRKSKPNEESGLSSIPQLSLPGFERIQTHYHVERDGEICLIRIDELSDQEIELKVEEYERMAEGCRLHAAELRRYKAQRRHELGA